MSAQTLYVFLLAVPFLPFLNAQYVLRGQAAPLLIRQIISCATGQTSCTDGGGGCCDIGAPCAFQNGVPICDELEKRTGRDVAIGGVYAALERLDDKGFVTSELGESTPERGGRAKRYFHVTARGLKEVRETQRALVKLWHGLPELEGGKA